MMLIFQRRGSEGKYITIRASAILAAHDISDGGCEISYITPTGEMLLARIVETATQVCGMVNSKSDRPDKVKFVVAVPESRLGYSDAINVARTVRDMVQVVERGE